MVGCWSIQDQLKTTSQWKGSIPQILAYSQFFKTSKNLQPTKQGLFSLILEAAIQINFAVSLARFFRIPILYIIIYVMQYRQKQPSRGVLKKGVLKICSKFTGEHPCWSVISNKLQSNFFEIALRHGFSAVNLLHIFRIPFFKNTSGWLLLQVISLWNE